MNLKKYVCMKINTHTHTLAKFVHVNQSNNHKQKEGKKDGGTLFLL